jgi:hypothetical protein
LKKTGSCCTNPEWDIDGKEIPDITKRKCIDYVGKQCGSFESYGQSLSLCCDNSTSVLHCDGSNISLTYDKCPMGFGCFQHYNGFGSKRSGGMGTYAQCEEIEK